MEFNFSNDLSTLTKYTDELSGKLIRQVVLQTPTGKLVNVLPNIKHAQSINIFSLVNLNMQSGGCGWLSSGDTAYTERVLTVAPVKVQNELCIHGTGSLEEYMIGQYMKPGSNGEVLPFSEVVTGLYSDIIAQRNETLIWRGSYVPTGTVSGDSANGISSANSNGVVGFLNIIDAASGSTVNITYSGAPTQANVISIVDSIVANLPADILGQKNIYIFCSVATVQAYKLAIRNSNAFHYFVENTTEVDTLTQSVPGFVNIKLIGTTGLGTSGRMVASYAENFNIGCDIVDELNGNTFTLFYDVYADLLKFAYRSKLGTQIAFPQHVVRY